MRGAIPPLPQYAFMKWCSVKGQGQINIFTFYGLCGSDLKQNIFYEIQKLISRNVSVLENLNVIQGFGIKLLDNGLEK